MGSYLYLPIVLFLIGLFGKIYCILTLGWCKSQKCLVGKTTIVTGANIGIGYETSLDFAKRGAKVILACRSEKKAKEAQGKIIEETGNENVHYKIVDFASFDSVRAFTKDINETEERLDILVNNAGASSLGDKRSEDGRVLLMQVNYYSSFLLTNLLINLLKKSAPSRVVNISSVLAQYAFTFDIDNLDQYYPNNGDYCNSKLCNVLFTMELAKRLEGTGVTTYSLHPGYVKTNIFHNTREIINIATNSLFLFLFAKTCEEGAQTTLHCSLEKGIEKYSGSYFTDCKVSRPFYLMRKDPVASRRLWQKTEEIVNLRPDEMQM